MPIRRKPLEIPPEAARSFMRDLRAYQRTKDRDKQTAIVARQAEHLSKHAGVTVTLAEVRELFRKMKSIE